METGGSGNKNKVFSTVSKPEGSKEPDTSEILDMSEEKFITRVIRMAIKEESKGEDIPAKTRRFTRSHS